MNTAVYGVYVKSLYGDSLLKIFRDRRSADKYRRNLQRVYYLTEGDEKIYQVKKLSVEETYGIKLVIPEYVYELSVCKYSSYGFNGRDYSTYSCKHVPTIIDKPFTKEWEKSEVGEIQLSDLPYPGKNKIFVACKFDSKDLHGVREYEGIWENGIGFSHCLKVVHFFRFNDYRRKAVKQLHRYLNKYRSIIMSCADRTNPFYYMSQGFKPLSDDEEFDLGYRRVLRYLKDKGLDFDDIKNLSMEKLTLMTNLNVRFFSKVHVFYKDVEFKTIKKHGLNEKVDEEEEE